MNAFVIVLIIFILYGICDSAKSKAKRTKFIKENTSNIDKQYEIACNIIEHIAELYREEASKLTIPEYFNEYFKMEIHLECDGILKNRWVDMNTALENIKPTEKSLSKSNNLEISWLYYTALACGFSIKNNFMSKIYKMKIWENLPNKIDDTVINNWQTKYKNAPKDKDMLNNLLNLSIECKKKILFADAKGSYYTDFNNKKILETIAEKIGVPTNAELKQMHRTSESFHNIQELARLYSCLKIREMGYAAHTYMLKIRPIPNKIEKEEVCQGCTQYEKWKHDEQKLAELKKKYPKF